MVSQAQKCVTEETQPVLLLQQEVCLHAYILPGQCEQV
ncbi:hypothetical protein ES703_104808 [subsurface metagenome]